MFLNTFGEEKNVCCGLARIVTENQGWPLTKLPVPLISVDVRATVVLAVAEVEVRQVYVNTEEEPIEAVYYFPIHPDGAVIAFEVEMDGRIIKATVKEREDPETEFRKAVKNKQAAFLGEESKADIFKARVGILRPSEEAKIRLVYVTEVKSELMSKDSFNIPFSIPSTIAPRFDFTKAKDTALVEHQDPPAALSIRVEISLQCGIIQHVRCPSHSAASIAELSPSENGKAWQKYLVELVEPDARAAMERDFLLVVETEKAVHKPVLYSEKLDDGSTAVMLHMVARLPLGEIKSELIFLVDRSGSMDGQSITLATSAVVACLRSMPADCYFNIVGYGSCHKFLHADSVKLGKKNLEEAVTHVNGMKADLGGTEILQPLKSIYGRPSVDGYFRTVFLLTDGDVPNRDAVFGIVKANAHNTRVYALGIGPGAGRELVEGTAKAGGGTAAFAALNEKFESKVLDQLKHALQPALTNIQIKWKGLENNQGYRQTPRQISPIYDGCQLLAFGLFQSDQPKAIKLTAQSPSGLLTLRVKLGPDNDCSDRSEGILHHLSAVKMVNELELEIASHSSFARADKFCVETVKKDIIEIACKNGLSSKYTCFVALDPSTGKIKPKNWVLETRYVPWPMNQDSEGVPGSPSATAKQYARGHSMEAFRSCAYVVRSCVGRPSPRQQMSLPIMESSGPELRVADAAMVVKMVAVKNKRSRKVRRQVSTERSPEPGAPPQESEENEEYSLLRHLSGMQSYEGCFDLSADFAAILNSPLCTLQAAAAKLQLDETVFATALAIVLSHKRAGREHNLEPLMSKARNWMEDRLGGPDEADQIINTVMQIRL